MSAKPSIKPAKPAPAKVSPKASGRPTPQKPATPTKPVGKPKPIKQAIAEQPDPEDDPFDVDTSAAAQSPPVAPRPAKGRMIRVVCPMCETPGFISPKMQGRDVKCCNKDCMVPIFKAPLPQKKEEVQEEPRGLFSATNLTIGTLVMAPLIAGLVWFFMFRKSGPEKYVPRERDVAEHEDAPGVVGAGINDAPPEALPTDVKVSLTDLEKQALEQVVIAARVGIDNRSKPYCRRMSAQAFADVGDLKEAREQLSRLRALVSEKFYQAEPLAAIAWQERATGDVSAASQTTTEAFDAATDFPSVGRAAPAAAAAVAAVLATDGRIEDAQEVFRRLNRDDDKALTRERVAALVQITDDLEMFDIDRILRYSSMDMAVDPLAVATATAIAAHGYWEQATNWSMKSANVAVQEDCMSAIAVIAARHQAATGDDRGIVQVQTAAKTLSTTGQSRVAVGTATGYLMHGSKEQAIASLATALELFEQIKRPDPVATPDVREIVDGVSLANGDPLQSAAIGAAQMARLQVLLDDPKNAWTTLLKAWEFTQGIAPNAQSILPLVNEVNDNSNRAEQRVKRDMRLPAGDVLTRTYRKYRRNVRDVGDATTRRLDLEVALLREAISWGLLDNVTEVIREPGAVISSAVGQPYETTSLPSTLSRYYEMAGNAAMSKEIAESIPDGEQGRDRVAELLSQTEMSFRAGKSLTAAKTLGDFSSSQSSLEQRRDLRALQLACRLVKQKQANDVFQFIFALKDDQLMDDCFEMTAALSVKHGLAADMWKQHENERLTPSQKVAFYRGLVSGIVAVNKQDAGDSVATAD
ncbi:MAG: hypothetical protein KDA86_19635 [Planctomycetaceae bacterium]|nr:hypothetical protein [Planctomycetaceae bacterium]